MRFATLLLMITALALAGCAPLETPIAVTEALPGEPGVTEPVDEGGLMDELAGTQWMLVSIEQAGQEIPVVEGIPATLEFQPGGEVIGEGGCNSFGGQYQVAGSSVIFSDITSTLIACEDQALMDQETQYFFALETASSFELSGDTLIITFNGGGDTLTFAAA
jgi:putative lipoprotein